MLTQEPRISQWVTGFRWIRSPRCLCLVPLVSTLGMVETPRLQAKNRVMIVHLGKDEAELQAITEGHPAYGSAWRRRDFEIVTSAEFRKALKENHVILVGWKLIKKLSLAKE